MSYLGVPVKLLYESVGLIVTLETQKGQLMRGKLMDVEDNMNCQLSNCTTTYRDGKVVSMDYVYIRGSSVLFMILPDMLKNAPMFTKIKVQSRKIKGSFNPGFGRGRGRGERGRGGTHTSVISGGGVVPDRFLIKR